MSTTRNGSQADQALASTCVTLALALAGCSAERHESSDSAMSSATDGEDGTAASTDDECLSDDAFFRDRVWADVLRPLCFECHRTGGEAEHSNLVLLDQDVDPDHQDDNRAVFAVSSSIVFQGEPLILAKATDVLSHEAGALFEVDSPEYRILEQMIARLREPTDCP